MKVTLEVSEPGKISDGYHTFDELYDHRITLWITLCRLLAENGNHNVWRSERHSDGSFIPDWFVLGYRQVAGKQITYHVPHERWGETSFAETMTNAPDFDGHTASDVLQRLKEIEFDAA